MEVALKTPDLDLPLPFFQTERIEAHEYSELKWRSVTTAIVDLTIDRTNPIFHKLLTQISIREFILLKKIFLDRRKQIDELNIEMERIRVGVGQKVKQLKKQLQQLQELFFTIRATIQMGINLEAIETADKIIAIQFEINNLYQHKRYNILSNRLSQKIVIPTSTFTGYELEKLDRLGLLEKNILSIILNHNTQQHGTNRAISTETNPNQYSYSKLGLAFVVAYENEQR